MTFRFFIHHPFFSSIRVLRRLLARIRGFFCSLGRENGGKLLVGRGCCFDCLNVRFGRNVTIGMNVHFFGQGMIVVGNNVTIGDNCIICSAKSVRIGNDSMIAANCYIIDCNHGTHGDTVMRSQPLRIKEVEIGNNVWIGCLTAVLAGSIIGDGCVVGAGSVINSVISTNSFVIPNRNLTITKRF